MYDIAIIGSGPGGYVAAIRAAQLGLKVAIIEKQHLGGICLNWGCIPTKSLLKCSELYHKIKHASEFGINVKDVSFDIKKVISRSREVSAKLAKGVEHLLKKNKVTVYKATGKILANNKISLTTADNKNSEISAKNIVIATGARARELPGFEADEKLIWNYRHAMTPDNFPKSLVIVGSGAIGIEFASFYRTLGAEVTVIEMQDRILPVEDTEISEFAKKSFMAQGMSIVTQANCKKVTKKQNSIILSYEHQEKEHQVEAERLIMAVGISANTESLGLENTKVKLDRGHIVTNEYMETGHPGIYAIGDVAGAPWLAHKASHEAIICVEKIAGKNPHKIDPMNIPGCTYSMPQVASIGLTEAQAKEQNYQFNVGRFPFMGNGKALAMGEDQGLIKLLFEKNTGELLGAHMVGAEVTELIHSLSVMRSLEGTEEDIFNTIFPHPTLSEMIHESALDSAKKAIHI